MTNHARRREQAKQRPLARSATGPRRLPLPADCDHTRSATTQRKPAFASRRNYRPPRSLLSASSLGSSGAPLPTNPSSRSRPPDRTNLDAGWAAAAARRRNLDQNYAIPTRDQSRDSSRPDTALRFRPAHLRGTVIAAAATVPRPPAQPPP